MLWCNANNEAHYFEKKKCKNISQKRKGGQNTTDLKRKKIYKMVVNCPLRLATPNFYVDIINLLSGFVSVAVIQ
jgi:hypothetical protein